MSKVANFFKEKVEKYYSLNTQIKKMSNIKKKLNDELKDNIILTSLDYEIELDDYRVVLDEKERTYPDNNKIKQLIVESGKKIKDYYNTTKFFTLNVVKKDKVLNMESIDYNVEN